MKLTVVVLESHTCLICLANSVDAVPALQAQEGWRSSIMIIVIIPSSLFTTASACNILKDYVLKRYQIKCDKAEPTCNHCVSAGVECLTAERRRRPRNLQQRVSVGHISQRLELLERQLGRPAVADASVRTSSIPGDATTTESAVSGGSVAALSPNAALMAENGTEC